MLSNRVNKIKLVSSTFPTNPNCSSNIVNKIKLVSRASTKEYSIIATIKLDLYNTLWFFLWYDDWYISPIFFGYDAYKK